MDNAEKEVAKEHTGNYSPRYLQFAGSLISGYNGIEPFHLYIKKYFSANKKHGSRDRKQIAQLCYDYFRLGHGVSKQASLNDKFLFGIFLCESSPSPLLSALKKAWNERMIEPLEDKLKFVQEWFDSKNIFPFPDALSDKINFTQFVLSFLQQPRLFIRIRPGKEDIVLNKLKNGNFSFEEVNNNCIAFSHNEKVTDTISVDNDAVIQDYNSQRIGDIILENISVPNLNENDAPSINVWDCCAGSGGKSILALDIIKNIKLTVTDVRSSIIQNLHKRFNSAGIKGYNSFVADITSQTKLPIEDTFQLIIADVPCSGSGTWSRTPEQLNFFKEAEITKYAQLQKNIIANVIPYLQDKGILFYITCSVFKQENEENVDFILNKFPLNLLKMEYLEGYDMQADTLFVAVFNKSSVVTKVKSQ